jgi:alpha-L-arabinofuranosidase
MRRSLLSLVVAILASGSIAPAQTTLTDPNGANSLVVWVDQAKETIAPEVYGHFAEHLGRCNLDPQKTADLPCQLKGLTPKAVKGRVLTAEAVNSHNTFEKPAVVEPKTFTGFKLEGDRVQIAVPARSVLALEIE